MVSKPKWKYGQFNSVEKDNFTRRLEKNSRNYLASTREGLQSVLYGQNLDITGDFIGVVLKQLPPSNTDSVSPLTRIFNLFGGGDDTPQQISVKVRVPEVHSLIPEPDDEDDDLSISLHDTFTGLVSEVGTFDRAFGQFVLVSFYDSSGVFNPKIKKRIGDGRSLLPETTPKAKKESETFVGPTIDPALGDPIGIGKKVGQQVSENAVNTTFVGPQIGNHNGKTRVEIIPSIKYKENRVRVHEGITSIPAGSSLLKTVAVRPSFPQRNAMLHILVAERFNALRNAAAAEGIDIYCQSGWRKHAFKSREDYEEKMIKKYGSVAEGKKWKAYISPHETGLAVDFYIPAADETEVDVAPSQPKNSKYGSQTNHLQKKTKAFNWLKENAHNYGFTPYGKEAWHWEVLIPIESWKTGAAQTSEFDFRNYDTRVIETSIANGSKTSDRNFTFE